MQESKNRLQIETINNETKKAWGDNWRPVTIKTILEIFTYPRVEKMLSLLRRYLPQKGFAIEAGCGLGPWVIKLREMKYQVLGIDYEIECIKKIREYDSSLPVYVGDVRKMPFKDKTFAAYLSFGVIEHFTEGPEEVLDEAFRTLAPDGRLILTVPHKNIFIRLKAPFNWARRNAFIRRLCNKPAKIFYYQRYFGVDELIKYVSESGFTVEGVIPHGHIFSLVQFSGVFRNRKTYDGENNIAVFLGNIMEKVFPWLTADSIGIIARKGNK